MRFKLNAYLAVLTITWVLQGFVNSQYVVEIDKGLEDKALTGFAFRNFTNKTVAECFLACFEDCLCLSFQMSKERECQLISSSQWNSTLDALTGSTYYDITPSSSEQVGLATSTSCSFSCRVNPCQNGGSHESLFPGDYATPHFKCTCAPGYAGNLCEDVVKSCRGYSNTSRVSGLYKVFDDDMNLFDVFCDFDLNSTMTWTLIQSFQLGNNETFRDKPFTADYPVNETSPNWDAYRLSKSRMQSIQNDSTKFRMTCSYDTDGVVYRDYLQAANNQLNILSFIGRYSCILVEWVNVRGYHCKNCTAYLVQVLDENLHIDSYHGSDCEFNPGESLSCFGLGEDNFGNYACVNPTHRCSSSPFATSQTWFGGL